jgi:hypothetical protein
MVIFFWPVLENLMQIGFVSQAIPYVVIAMLITFKNLPVFAQLLLIALSLISAALTFVLSASTLASAAREMLGLKEGQIEDMARKR